MTLQFINMHVMKLIIYPESWNHQILFNSFIFGIALRNKHFKVNIFSESSLCGLLRVLQTTTFFLLLNIFLSFFSRAGLGFGCFYWGFCGFFFFFNAMPFLIQLLPFHTYLGMCAHTHAFFLSILKEKTNLKTPWLLN